MNINQTAEERRDLLDKIYRALLEQNYDPIRQLQGYLLSGDPTYIPDHKNARTLIATMDRSDLLEDLIRNYFTPDRKVVSP